MIATTIFTTDGFDDHNNDERIASELGLPIGNYQSRRDVLVTFLNGVDEYTEAGFLKWLHEEMKPTEKMLRGIPPERRSPTEEYRTPSLSDMAKSAVKETMRHAKSKFKNVSKEVEAHRVNTCNSCDLLMVSERHAGRCKVCGCFMKVKARWETSKCPIGKW